MTMKTIETRAKITSAIVVTSLFLSSVSVAGTIGAEVSTNNTQTVRVCVDEREIRRERKPSVTVCKKFEERQVQAVSAVDCTATPVRTQDRSGVVKSCQRASAQGA